MWEKPVLTHASRVREILLASMNSVKKSVAITTAQRTSSGRRSRGILRHWLSNASVNHRRRSREAYKTHEDGNMTSYNARVLRQTDGRTDVAHLGYVTTLLLATAAVFGHSSVINFDKTAEFLCLRLIHGRPTLSCSSLSDSMCLKQQ